jgi:hypothetical protein
MRVLFWPLISWWAWAQTVSVVADTIGEGAALSFDRSVGVGSDSHCRGGQDL